MSGELGDRGRGRKVAGAIRSLVNARGLHEALLVSVMLHGSGAMIWREKEMFRKRNVQMGNLRGLGNE